MYFGETPEPLKVPSSDVEWAKLFELLNVPVSKSPTDEIIAYHNKATEDWSKVRSQSDRTVVRDLSGFMQRCVEAAYTVIVSELSAYKDIVPTFGAIVPQLQAAKVRETEEGKQYSILMQIRDVYGRSLAIFENGMSIPTQSAMMIEVVTDAELNKISHFIRASKEALQEDLVHAERMVKIDGADVFKAGFRPVTFRIIQQVMSARLGEEALDPAFVSDIKLELDREEGGPEAIAHVATKKGRYRISIRYNPETCGPMAILSPEHGDIDWNSNQQGE